MRKTSKSSTPDSGRLREIAAVLARHKIVKGVGPKKLRAIVEDLGPTFIKLGQILSMRMDMLPAAYCQELAGLRVDVRPMAFDQVRAVIEQEYSAPLEEVFSSFDRHPLGSASIAQVHAATLKSGRRVAVKVQRPGVRETMARDIGLFHRAARYAKLTKIGQTVDLDMVLDELWAHAQQEMDFLMEAQNAEEFRLRNRDVPDISCPEADRGLTTAKVLVMEYVDGVPLDSRQALRDQGTCPEDIGQRLAENYIKQIVDDGFFHADPHPGNLRLRDGQIVWLDMGLMGRLTNRDRELLRKSVEAVALGDVDGLERAVCALGICHGPVDHHRLYDDLARFLEEYGSMDLGGMDLGNMLEEVMGIARDHRISVPQGVSMLARGMINLEGVLALISPKLNLVELLAGHMKEELLRGRDWKNELREGARQLAASGKRVAELPAQLSDLLRQGLRGQVRLQVRADWDKPVEQFGRIADRLIRGILAAALWIGASLIYAAGAGPKLWGMPALSVTGYSLGLVLALWALRRKG